MLFWNFSASISYTDGSWDSVEIREENGQYSRRGPDISAHRETVEFFEQIGLQTKAIEEFPNIASIVFRFSATYYNASITVASGIDEATIEGNNIPLIRAVLQSSQNFADNFLNGQTVQLYGFDFNEDEYPYFSVSLREDFYNPYYYGPVRSRLNRTRYGSGGISYGERLVPIDASLMFRFKVIQSALTNYLVMDRIQQASPTAVITPIQLSEIIYNMPYNAAVDVANETIYIISDGELISITFDGTVDRLGPVSVTENGPLVFVPEQGLFLFSNNDDKLYATAYDGQQTEVAPLTVPHESNTIFLDNLTSVSFADGVVYLYCRIQNFDGDSEYRSYISSVNLTNGEITPLGLFEFFMDVQIVGYDNAVLMVAYPDSYDNSPYEYLNLESGRPYFFIAIENGNTYTINNYVRLSDNISSGYDEFSATYNYDDGCVYIFGVDDFENHMFIKKDFENGEDTELELPSYLTPKRSLSYIADGEGDMYDNANIICTNLAGVVEYTHTQQVYEGDNENLAGLDDSEVVNSDNVFGPGSQYFTTYHPGFFTLCATNVNIDEFKISGNIGADGDGQVSGGQFDITNNSTEYTVYYKKVYAADDPSIEHLIIIPKKSGVVHSFPTTSEADAHSIFNIGSVNRLYYLLFSTDEDNPSNVELYEDVADTFLNIVQAAPDADGVLTALYAGIGDVLSLLESRTMFTDRPNDARRICYFSGNYDPLIVYLGDDDFFVYYTPSAFFLTPHGEMVHLSFTNTPTRDIQSIVAFGRKVYGFLDNNDGMVEFNLSNQSISDVKPYTIVLHPEYDYIPVEELTWYGVDSAAVKDGEIYAIVKSSHGEFIGKITSIEDTATIELIHRYPTTWNTDVKLLNGPEETGTSIGMSSKNADFVYWSMTYDQEENITRFDIRMIWMPVAPTASNLIVQQAYVLDISDIENNDWSNSTIVEVSELQENNVYTITLDGILLSDVSSYIPVTRARYADDESGNWLYFRYD